MKQITVNDLLAMCQAEVKNGNGDKNIVLSDDSEGNGYHGMFFGFQPMSKDIATVTYDSCTRKKADTIVLG